MGHVELLGHQLSARRKRTGWISTTGKGPSGSALTSPKDGRLEFNFRWMNGITNFDGFAFNPATFTSDPADVLGAKSTSQQYVYSGSYLQPLTNWWSQKLTLARATESLTSYLGSFQRNLVTGVEDVPFKRPQKSTRRVIVSNGSTIFR
jgi:vitamin B12 transporter